MVVFAEISKTTEGERERMRESDEMAAKYRPNEGAMMDRRTFIGYGTLAASVLAGGRLAEALAQENKGAPGATVETAAGKLRGLAQGKVSAFKVVSYGAATAGNLRFMRLRKKSSVWQLERTLHI